MGENTKHSDAGKDSQPTIIYLHRSPDLNPRTLKIKYSLEKNGFKFIVFRPKLKVNMKSRLLSSLINYFLFFLQTLFVQGDIIWVSNCPDTVGLGPWITNRSYVYDFRSPWSKEVEIEFGKGIFPKIAGMIETLVRTKANAIVVVSSQMVKDVDHLGKKVFVVPNYPLQSFLSFESRESIRAKAGCTEHTKVVTFVGKLSRVEGADMLEKIVQGLGALGDIKLWIIGDGPLRSQIQDVAIKYPSIVTFFGWIDYKQVPNYIAAADVCIVPRHKNSFSEYYNEQGVLKISEYIAMGRPVVACNIAKSDSYILVSEESFIDGIRQALEKNQSVKKRFWESDSESRLIEAVGSVLLSSAKKNAKKSNKIREEKI